MKLVNSLVVASFAASVALLAVGCGPAGSGLGGDDVTTGDDDTPCSVTGDETTPATCGDGHDNDCDGKPDCEDPDCSGIGACPICGEINTAPGAGIVLPDGIVGEACTSDAQCGASTPNCVEQECHASYTSTLDVIGFGPNQTFDNVNLIESVCVTMEHSWLRDMEIRLIAPGGQLVRMQKFLGRTGGEIYLGQANDCDEGAPQPGTGAMYCWKPTATNPPMLDYANNNSPMGMAPTCDGFGFNADELPPGDYAAADPWNQLMGSPLNGSWKFVVTDLWPIDNGFLFDWTIKFNANAVADCSGPIIN